MTTVIDGGLSTALVEQGHDLSDHLWTARLLADQPEAIVAAHLAYLHAGADIIITASYQASVAGFVAAGFDAREAGRLVGLATTLAIDARRRFELVEPAAARRVRVAASVGPYGAVLADGSEYRGDYAIDHDGLVAFHRERLALLVASEPDLLAVETIPSAAEARAVVEALADHPGATAWITFSCRSGHETCAGDAIEDAVAIATSSPQVVAVGVNCTAPGFVEELLRRAASMTERPLVTYPNSGQTWDSRAKQMLGEPLDLTADGAVHRWQAAGASYIGGCCGIGPETIARLARTIRGD
jgi:homocysteine S-methyltransferase